ncbi:hypothetical protein G6541_23430, partial [Streptomyces albidoflavus]|nr:hypothetical protein [Streptomyces albidoflavus]
MTDQVVGTSTSGPRAPGASPASGAPRPDFFGRGRELRELRAEIDRAGLDTIAGRGAPRPRFLAHRGRPAPAAPRLAGRP